jgi:hypothetical protein
MTVVDDELLATPAGAPGECRLSACCWQSIQVKGLDAVLAERRPSARPARVCTVGEYILDDMKPTGGGKPANLSAE